MRRSAPRVTYAKQLMHGKQSMVKLDVTCPIVSGLPEEISAARYHSLAAEPDTMSRCTESRRPQRRMARSWRWPTRAAPVYGLQFHPESILTPDGRRDS